MQKHYTRSSTTRRAPAAVRHVGCVCMRYHFGLHDTNGERTKATSRGPGRGDEENAPAETRHHRRPHPVPTLVDRDVVAARGAVRDARPMARTQPHVPLISRSESAV